MLVLCISLIPLFMLATTMLLAPDALHGLLRWCFGVSGYCPEVLVRSRERIMRSIRIAGVVVLLVALVLSYLTLNILSLQALQ